MMSCGFRPLPLVAVDQQDVTSWRRFSSSLLTGPRRKIDRALGFGLRDSSVQKQRRVRKDPPDVTYPSSPYALRSLTAKPSTCISSTWLMRTPTRPSVFAVIPVLGVVCTTVPFTT